jgi:hypothetical protein
MARTDDIAGLPLTQKPSSTPAWLRRPADKVVLKTDEDYVRAINQYFEQCDSCGIPPRFSGLALVLGLPGVSTIYRLARRRPSLTGMISRAITAIAYHYESQLDGRGARGAIFALQHLQDFDLAEPEGSAPIQSWQAKAELTVNHKIPGVADPATKGAELTPEAAYLLILRGEKVLPPRHEVKGREIEGEVVHDHEHS